MNMKKRLLSALTLVALVVQLLGCLPAAAATTTTAAETPEIPKFLIIGNSFARDPMSFFPDVLKAEGVTEFTIGYLYRGSCSLNTHVTYAKNGQKGYSYRKITQDDDGWNIPDNNTSTMLEAIQDEEWDYVFLQQVSGQSAEADTYNEDLDFLMEYVKQNVSNPAVKLGWQLTWPYSAIQDGANYDYLSTNFQGDPQLMYQAISNAVQTQVLSRPFSIVIPSGTAMTNARSSHMGDTIYRATDGYHLSAYGKLLTAYCWYAALTGKTIDSLKYVPTGSSVLGTLPELTEKDKAVIVEAVNNAVANPYSITVPTLDDSTVLYSKTSDELYAIAPTEERQIITYWGPNTEDVELTTNKVRKDIAFSLWTQVTGLQENEDSGYLAHFITKPHYDSAGEFSYGLRNEEDGTPNTLSLTLKEGVALDTTKYGEIELTFQHVRRDLVVPTIDTIESGFRVQVSTDGGTTWKDGYAGMKSHRIIAEGRLLKTTGNVAKCYEVKSTDLSVLAEGEIINAIRILPYGDFDDFTTENTFVRAISITGYESAAPAEEKEMVAVEGDIQRQIVAAHAKRLNSATWVSSADVQSNVQWADDGTVDRAITYYGGVRYSGPIYSGKNASTYERFLSDIDKDENYNGALEDTSSGDEGINGMDCGTVVYDCLSQITTSRSLSNWYYLFYDLYDETANPNGKAVPLYPAAGRGNIERSNHNEYFDELNEQGDISSDTLYSDLQPGDFIYNEGHTRVITSPTKDGTVYVGETAGGTIQHHYRLTNGEEYSFVKASYNEDPEAYVRANPDTVSEHLYSTSMRYDREISTDTIYAGQYLPYTLKEYEDGAVEKENVLITTNSGDFITNGFCAAIDSNYIIRTLTVTLTDKSETEPLYSKSVYGVQSDYSYLFADEALNTALAALEGENGQYELKVEVLSGPRIYLADGSVISAVADASNTVNPTTTFTYNLSSQHTQTVGEVENGTVMLNKTSAQYGDTVIVTAVPDPGYKLEAIYVDGNSIEGNTFTVSGEHVVTAAFVKATYTVTATDAEHGTVTVDVNSGFYGDIVTVTTVPADHYELKHILVNGYAIEGNTFPIARNQFVTAEFEPVSYTVTVTAADNGAVTVDKYSGAYGETVTVTAHPADGYMLSTILVDGSEKQGNTFTIRGNHTVTAIFAFEGIVLGEDETAPVAIPGPQTEPEEEPEVGYVSTRLALEGLIRLEVLATMTGFDEELDLTKAAGMLVWNENPGDTPEEALNNTEVESYTVTGVQEYESGKYIMSTNGIPAKEWGDTVYMLAFVTDKDGSKVYADSILTSSPRIQAEYLIKKEPEFADVSIALLNYGAAAQTYFNYKADELMNASLGADQTVLNWDESWLVKLDGKMDAQFEPSDKVQITDAQLALEGAIDLNYRVSVDGSVNVAESGLLVWTKDQYSGRDTLTEETASKYELEVESDYYVGRCAQIPAAEIGQTVYACAYVVDENNNKYYSDVLVYSPMAYAEAAIEYYEQTNVNLVNCMKWLVKYGHEASVVFKTGEE